MPISRSILPLYFVLLPKKSYCTKKNIDFEKSNANVLSVVCHYKIYHMKDLNEVSFEVLRTSRAPVVLGLLQF